MLLELDLNQAKVEMYMSKISAVWVHQTAKGEQTPIAEILKAVLLAAPAGSEISNMFPAT